MSPFQKPKQNNSNKQMAQTLYNDFHICYLVLNQYYAGILISFQSLPYIYLSEANQF